MAVTAQMRTQVSQLYVALFGRAPDSEGLGFWVQELAAGKSLVSVANTMYAVPAARAYYPSFLTNEEIIISFYKNVLGRTPDTEGKNFWTGELNKTGATVGSVIAELVKVVVNYTGTDEAGLKSKALFMNKVEVAQYYGEADGSVEGATAILGDVTDDRATVKAATDIVDAADTVAIPTALTRGVDALNGSAGNDTFKAIILNNANTLESGDVINGGTGDDRLEADIGTSQNFAITPETTGIETVAIRAQAVGGDTNNNNMSEGVYGNVAQIDAERMVGVTQWESNNSRADVVIEDVRILDSQITKDITIAMVETDPGHVDFGVYFDQYSLRSSTTTSASQIAIKLRDGMMPSDSEKPLGNLMVDGVEFKLTTPAAGGKPASTVNVVLKSADIDAASNYVQLAAALNKAIAASPEASAAKLVASVGDAFSSLNNVAANGYDVLITSQSGLEFSAPIFTYSKSETGAFVLLGNTSVVKAVPSLAPVTSTIILDDVGRGSTGGDLVVGGLSVGQTSSSQGVERFEIEVRDNSKLETISSTNNTLEEVTIKNGLTTSSSYAYGTTVKNEGDLTVNGVSGTNGANVTDATNGLTRDGLVNQNTSLPGSNQQQLNGFGFSDVRLIDATGFKGNLEFSAEVTTRSIAKYLNLQDIQARPAGDNVDFTYTGGLNDDTMFIQIDGNVASSRNTIVSGREDFTFTANGGNGNDTITLNLSNLTNGNLDGNAQAWYTNQKLNKNVSINGGAGDDTITTPGAGDVIINGGAGNDTVYTDNTGLQQPTPAPAGAWGAAAAAYSAASAAQLSAAITLATAANATDEIALGKKFNKLLELSLNTDIAKDKTNAVVTAAIKAAFDEKTITAAQQTALQKAYGTTVAGTVSDAELKAGDALLATYLTEVSSKLAAAQAAEDAKDSYWGYLTDAQRDVVDSTIAIKGVSGTAADVANLTALKSAITDGAKASAVQAATQAALAKGAITGPEKEAIDGAVGVGPVDAAVLKAVTAVLAPIQAAANIANADAVKALAKDEADYAASVDDIAEGISPEGFADDAEWLAQQAKDDVESFTEHSADVIANHANLADLKAAIKVGTLDYQVDIATKAAVANGALSEWEKDIIDDLGMAGAAGVDAFEKAAVDSFISMLEAYSNLHIQSDAAWLAKIKAVAALTNTAALAAREAADSGPAGPALAPTTGTYVFNTANQSNVGAGYSLAINDERNGADLKSDTSQTYNLFKSDLTVSFKGISATVTVPSTSYKTTDLQVNQAIKDAINNDAVLSKLLVANDGPGNTLVVTSLIDGALKATDLSVSVAVPKASDLAGDVAAVAKAYGLSSTATAAQVIAAMTTAKAAFDTNGDYVAQLTETGAANGNAPVTGATSSTSSDNTVNGGAGNDVIVLGTTVGSDRLASSNDRVVFNADFSNDVIVNFAATGMGRDTLDLTALGGKGSAFDKGFATNHSIVVALRSNANDTDAEIIKLFDDATASKHVYIAYNADQVGTVYQVTDAAGAGAAVKVVGTIDLADTLWNTLTGANFA